MAASEQSTTVSKAVDQAVAKITSGRVDVSVVIETMLKHADTALYKAKASGKDRCVVYSDLA